MEFVSISQVINHITSYNLNPLIGEITTFRLENKSCKGFFLNKFSTNESTRIITGHVIYNLAYTYKFQLKTTIDTSYNS